jgi:hypothetical protein
MRDPAARSTTPLSISLDQLLAEVPSPRELINLLSGGFEEALGIRLRAV